MRKKPLILQQALEKETAKSNNQRRKMIFGVMWFIVIQGNKQTNSTIILALGNKK